jgi:hypothetical protein
MSSYVVSLRAPFEEQGPFGDHLQLYFRFVACPTDRPLGTSHDIYFGVIAKVSNSLLGEAPWRDMGRDTVAAHVYAVLRREIEAGACPAPGDRTRLFYAGEQPYAFDRLDQFAAFRIQPRIGFAPPAKSAVSA